jgi:uncharacterized protein YjbI with pentapeptide repeats
VSAPTRPDGDAPAQWRAYWHACGQPWRTEPEISASRVRALRFRLDVARDRGEYPFKDVEPRLTRADIEWLLANHEHGRGPVHPYATEDDGRVGLDLRGADLRELDLSGLPLARLRSGLPESEWRFASRETLETAAIRLDGARLERTHLEGAELAGAHLAGATLDDAYLEGATLSQADLAGVSLLRTRLDGAFLGGARLSDARLDEAQMHRVFLVAAHLQGASLVRARLEGAALRLAYLEGADATGAYLAGADLTEARLGGARLVATTLDAHASLRRAVLTDKEHGPVALADVTWGGASTEAADWTRLRRLGDEVIARTSTLPDGKRKSRRQRLDEYLAAARAYDQVAGVLSAAGLRREVRRFGYRALLMQGTVWRRQWRLPTYLLWGLVFLVTGYGYKPLRTLACYLLVVAAFAAAYIQLANGALTSALAWKDALVLSVGAFHGAALFAMARASHPTSTLSALVLAEAAVGLFIELTVIASFARRQA